MRKEPKLAIKEWHKYLIIEKASATDIIELYENWIDRDFGLVLVDEAGTDYRIQFLDWFLHCIDDSIFDSINIEEEEEEEICD